MSITNRLGVPTLCYVLSALLIGLPSCAQKPVDHPEDVSRLLVDYHPAPGYQSDFEPVPEDELANFELPPTKPYQIGNGDQITVRVLIAEKVTGFEGPIEVKVKEDGNVYLPLLGKVAASGKTVLEMEKTLTERLQDYVRGPIVSVEVTGFGSKRFYVVGQVGTPSALPVNGKTTLLEALIAVGGTSFETADVDEDYIVREGQAVPFSIRDIVMRGHPAGRLVMQENDVVYVPHVKDRTDYVYIFGEVRNPTRIAMKQDGPRGEPGRMTLVAAVAQAGGLNPGAADINDIRIYRGGWQHPKQFVLGIHEVYRYGEDIFLKPGDRIAVGTSDMAAFQQTIAPTLTLISATSSVSSLALSAVALTRK